MGEREIQRRQPLSREEAFQTALQLAQDGFGSQAIAYDGKGKSLYLKPEEELIVYLENGKIIGFSSIHSFLLSTRKTGNAEIIHTPLNPEPDDNK